MSKRTEEQVRKELAQRRKEVILLEKELEELYAIAWIVVYNFVHHDVDFRGYVTKYGKLHDVFDGVSANWHDGRVCFCGIDESTSPDTLGIGEVALITGVSPNALIAVFSDKATSAEWVTTMVAASMILIRQSGEEEEVAQDEE